MPSAPRQRSSALIADDELSNRLILRALLEVLGYAVIEAEDGERAVKLFALEGPSLVLMDVMMPVMDGYEAAFKIKQMAGSRFVPIIFLTAVTDEAALARCIEVGGDDYLIKPYSHMALSAKVLAMERIQRLHEDLRILYSRMQRDEEIAAQVFASAVLADNVALEQIHTFTQPASVFCGDILLSAFSPSRDLYVMLGDFTGHGLSAALGALPISEVFRSMTAKGFQPRQILQAINNKLHSLLPTGMFLAAQFIKIGHALDYLSVINCGMPELFILDNETRRIKHAIVSQSVPLGILGHLEDRDAWHNIEVSQGDRILLTTDGVTEARNPEGDYFGAIRLKQSIAHGQRDTYVLDRIIQGLHEFCRNAPQDDDITLAEIPLIPELVPESHSVKRQAALIDGLSIMGLPELEANGIEFAITLRGNQLRQINPVPLLINYLQDTTNLARHRQPLFTILTELFVNALDHGVLELDSNLKQTTDGINRYFQAREKLLQHLEQGFVRISVVVYPTEPGGYILIEVEDSGPGFNLEQIKQANAQVKNYSGRGITLVENLCESLQYFTPGNRVEAVYRWLEA
jgi:CheY-like chemotaxis protein